ncbi:hypothetical protein [Actinocorallia lasiicapitis]
MVGSRGAGELHPDLVDDLAGLYKAAARLVEEWELAEDGGWTWLVEEAQVLVPSVQAVITRWGVCAVVEPLVDACDFFVGRLLRSGEVGAGDVVGRVLILADRIARPAGGPALLIPRSLGSREQWRVTVAVAEHQVPLAVGLVWIAALAVPTVRNAEEVSEQGRWRGVVERWWKKHG